MAKLNTRAERGVLGARAEADVRVAGGGGAPAAVQGAEALLRRAVLANLLWENLAYEDGETVAKQIAQLIPQVPAERVAAIAVEARTRQKLRHVPLLIAREMLRHAEHRKLVGSLLPEVIRRPDEITEFLALYWAGQKGEAKSPLAKQAKVGLRAAFGRFADSAYSLAKYRGEGKAFTLRDAMFLVHPRPENPVQAENFRLLANNELPTPDTWEVALSSGADKRATWERLISEGKLGALAFVRNLRNMEQAGVDAKVIRAGFAAINPQWLLPLNMVAAAKHAPTWKRELEALMLRCLGNAPRLPGRTILIVDVSGSMGATISGKSELTRLDAAASLAMLAAEVCESVAIYATAGEDPHGYGSSAFLGEHKTELLKPRRGFALADDVRTAAGRLGGGGIFTRQALEYVKGQEREQPDRIMVFSDSQDCDRGDRTPRPFGKRNYIVDVSSHTRGVNYAGVWDAEVVGWSENFLTYVAALEGVSVQGEHDGE